MTPLIYVAGKYTDDTSEGIEKNVKTAIEAGIVIRKLGGVPIIPHLNHYIAPFLNKERQFDLDYWLEWDLPILEKCDAIYMLPQWYTSKGAIIEHGYAIDNLIPVLLDMQDVKVFIAAKKEQKCK